MGVFLGNVRRLRPFNAMLSKLEDEIATSEVAPSSGGLDKMERMRRGMGLGNAVAADASYFKLRQPSLSGKSLGPAEYPKGQDTMVRIFRSNAKQPPNLQLSHHLRMI